jgi:hypothetical protein
LTIAEPEIVVLLPAPEIEAILLRPGAWIAAAATAVHRPEQRIAVLIEEAIALAIRAYPAPVAVAHSVVAVEPPLVPAALVDLPASVVEVEAAEAAAVGGRSDTRNEIEP